MLVVVGIIILNPDPAWSSYGLLPGGFLPSRLSSLQLVVVEIRQVGSQCLGGDRAAKVVLTPQLGPVLLPRQGGLRRSPANQPFTLALGGWHRNPMI